MNWEGSGEGTGQKERIQRRLELGEALRDWCGNLEQWKLPGIYKSDPNEDTL